MTYFFPELALYALDVYYNQTYGFGGSSGNYGYANSNAYAQYSRKDDNLALLYQDYPKYKDPFAATFRGFGANAYTYDKIIQWIALAREV